MRAIAARLPLALLLLALAAGLATPAARAQPGQPTAFLFRGGSSDSSVDARLGAALQSAGFLTTVSTDALTFDGSQASLAGYSLVAISAPPTPAGMTALANYVNSGGALIVSGQLVRALAAPAAAGNPLRALLPATSCGDSTAQPSTTLTAALPNTVLNAGLPASFSVSLDTADPAEDGEVCLTPRDGATTLYASSHGGGAAGGPALVAWEAGTGRVAALSLLLGAADMAGSSPRRLVGNLARWLAINGDLTPPAISSLGVSGAASLTSSRSVSLSFGASDAEAGVGAFQVVEYVYSDPPMLANGTLAGPAWRIAQRSAWTPFGGGARTVAWTLSADVGVHYLQVFVADRVGNITPQPGLVFTNYLPAGSQGLAAGTLKLFRVNLAPGPTTVRLTSMAGGQYLTVVTPSREDLVDQQAYSFTAGGGGYHQLTVEGAIDGSYRLAVEPGSNQVAKQPVAQIERRPRGSIITLYSLTPSPADAELDPAPVLIGPAATGRSTVILVPLAGK